MGEHTVMATLYEDSMGNLYWHDRRLSRFHPIGNGKNPNRARLIMDAICLYRGDLELHKCEGVDVAEGQVMGGRDFTPVAHVYEDGEIRIYAERMCTSTGYYCGFGPMLSSEYYHPGLKTRNLKEDNKGE